MGHKSIWGAGAALVWTLALMAQPVSADTLADAMSQAYLGNPTLNSARAAQRATDEQVPQALSGWRPTIQVQGNLAPTWTQTRSYAEPVVRQTTISGSDGTVSIQLSQPVFNGFQTVESTAEAKANVKAGRADLLVTEQTVLFNAVQAYMNVYAGRQLVELQKENVGVLQAQLGAANERFKVGEITRTDVEQSLASLSQAKSSLAVAQATLARDAATYLQVIGKEAGKLTYPLIAKLPPSLNAAYQKAAEINPNIVAQAYVEEASVHDIEVKRAPLLPQVYLQAQASTRDDLTNAGGGQSVASVSGVLTVPIYDAGLNYSKVREAKQIASENRIKVIVVARAVRQAVAEAWNFYHASIETIAAAKDQVSAANLALSGVQQEYQAGTRTTLDVLDAQQAVVTARTTLVNAQKAQVVFAYQLLAAVGRLTARDLALNVPYYDVNENYKRVKDKWIGTDAETLQ